MYIAKSITHTTRRQTNQHKQKLVSFSLRARKRAREENGIAQDSNKRS